MYTIIVAHNYGMRFFKSLNKLQTALLLPFIICSVCIAAAEILQLISINISSGVQDVLNGFSQVLYTFLGYVLCYFATLRLTGGKHAFKAFWSVLCLVMLNTTVSSFYGDGTLYIFGIVTALFCSFCFNRFDKILSMSVTMVCSILFGILIGFLLDYWTDLVMRLSELISGKSYFSPVLFTVFDNIFSLFGIDTLKEMIFYKSYGGSVVYGGEIVTGVKDLFASGYAGELVSSFLSGHYFLLFALLGISISLFTNLKGVQRYVLAAVTVCALVSGNISILLLFLFLESPFLFIAVLLIGAAAYLTAYILELGMGYVLNGGIVEMIVYADKIVYLLAGGVVFVAIGYFVYKFIYEKHGITDSFNAYIPTRLNSFVSALGGISNIIRFKNDGLEVRNPKLIDTVSLDCEIKENFVTTKDKRMIELKEYL